MRIWTIHNELLAGRIRRSLREIAVAVVLTLAALVFGLSALRGPTSETASVEPPHEAPESQPN